MNMHITGVSDFIQMEFASKKLQTKLLKGILEVKLSNVPQKHPSFEYRSEWSQFREGLNAVMWGL